MECVSAEKPLPAFYYNVGFISLSITRLNSIVEL